MLPGRCPSLAPAPRPVAPAGSYDQITSKARFGVLGDLLSSQCSILPRTPCQLLRQSSPTSLRIPTPQSSLGLASVSV